MIQQLKEGYVYILECSDGTFYTGSTINLETRLKQHQSGKGAKHTRARLPVKLVYAQRFSRIQEAFYREKQIQGWSRLKKLALIKGKYNQLHELAECKNQSNYKNFDNG